MRIRSGGEPNKRGGLFACNFFETHRRYRNFGKDEVRKPFPSNERRARIKEREELVASLRVVTSSARRDQSNYYKALRVVRQSTLLRFKDLPQVYLEYLLDEFRDTIYLIPEKLSIGKLFQMLREKWEIIKPIVKPETLPSGTRLAGVKFFLWGIPNPFFVTVYDVKQMLAKLV